MTTISKTLNSVSHRPWDLPSGLWSYYQEWNNALFLHYRVSAAVLEALIPKGLELDLFEGDAWVSVVAFKMEKIRPRMLPSLSLISDFFEINVRTYVIKDNKPGVYFLNIEAQKMLSVYISRNISGLPYEKANINNSTSDELTVFRSSNVLKNFKLEASFRVGDILSQKNYLDSWLTERYCLYLDRGLNLFRYEIHHDEWEVREVDLKLLDIRYEIGSLSITSNKPDLVHYSKGVKVLAWHRTEC